MPTLLRMLGYGIAFFIAIGIALVVLEANETNEVVGEKLTRAIEAGFRPRSFLLAERWLRGLQDVVERWPEVPVLVQLGAGGGGSSLVGVRSNAWVPTPSL